jgi:NAD-reducing hydrogenase small subunit
MSDAAPKPRIATVSLAGCFGCHMSLLDMDEHLFELAGKVVFDRSPLTDLKTVGECDLGLVEGGVCNAENVHMLREFRRRCKTLVAIGACAINGGLPALRNHLDVGQCLLAVYRSRPGLDGGTVPDDTELPLLLDKVRPIHEVVHVDYYLPGCPPSGEVIWKFLSDLLAGRTPDIAPSQMRFD